jgi:23S rRNA pseudouridine1911/1915/1917 synthase
MAKNQHRNLDARLGSAQPVDQHRQDASPDVAGPLLPWLLAALRPMSRTRIKELLHRGHVTVNGVVTTRFDHPLQPGDSVKVAHQKPLKDELAKVGLRILYMDEHILVIDKPAGLLTVATEGEKTRTAFALLLSHLEAHKQGRPFVVHRIDRETSGLLLFALSGEVRDRLQKNWSSITKTYLGVVEGQPRPPKGTVRSQLRERKSLRVHEARDAEDARLAVTHYRLLSTRAPYSLVEVELETGRKHQIRVHMADLGCPIMGDAVYGAKTNPANRLGLHAWRLELAHPVTREPLTFTSPLPAVLQKLVP